jgi:recombination protein RecT
LAYLVPRDGKVCLDISYMGMMHLAQQCGAIQWGQAVLVREGDQFVNLRLFVVSLV